MLALSALFSFRKACAQYLAVFRRQAVFLRTDPMKRSIAIPHKTPSIFSPASGQLRCLPGMNTFFTSSSTAAVQHISSTKTPVCSPAGHVVRAARYASPPRIKNPTKCAATRSQRSSFSGGTSRNRAKKSASPMLVLAVAVPSCDESHTRKMNHAEQRNQSNVFTDFLVALCKICFPPSFPYSPSSVGVLMPPAGRLMECRVLTPLSARRTLAYYSTLRTYDVPAMSRLSAIIPLFSASDMHRYSA